MFGLIWPDFDQSIPLLTHRSGLTHSVLLPLLLLVFGRRWRWAALVAAGLALGIAVHISADVFPQSMRGFATVKLPFVQVGALASRLWLIGNVLGGIVIGLVLIEDREGAVAAWIAAAATAVLALAYFILHDEPPWMLPGIGAALLAGHGPARRAGVTRLRAGRIQPRPDP